MYRQIACRWVRTVAAIVVSVTVALSTAAAQQSSPHDPAELEAIRLLLDRIEGTLRREGLSVQALYDLGQTLNPTRDDLHARVADLEPQFAQVEARLKQLGPPPAKDAPPETPALAEERVRLNKEYSEIEAPLKQTRVLAERADQLSDQITERRRAAYARQLFEQSPSVLSPTLWLDSTHALGGELSELGRDAARLVRSDARAGEAVRMSPPRC